MTYKVRPATAEDKSYIFKSWMRGLHRIPPFLGSKDRLFYPYAQRFLEKVLYSKHTNILLLCDPNDEQFIISFAVFWKYKDFTVLWWLYVRDIFRKQGIARTVIDSIPTKGRAFVFAPKYKELDVSKKLMRPAGFEYWPTLMFEAMQIGGDNDH